MHERPPHPESDDRASDHPDRRRRDTSSRGTYALVIAGVLLVLVVVVLHLTGVVGPSAH